ncbi:hypothetical protein CHLRE_01g048750v5 [Chlamydomonas reinhardtii]|uniref:PROP1-like PPR domain-containing protein n=1 Tax=Chlamydomonas reinhardtii TaxID=3055 RepID=A8HN88_CHLRE|nr:uncharacterized protein CHLRE_01g048750v5 [Chlamydomonas reinhardtii]PNW88876.1 hypothetical protein CHLRE_01g048750v5 [Chlamydomonas reinhardtii]|eukprot:XP_001690230.1 predicted protein [Chlamydomonas reinhardtii]
MQAIQRPPLSACARPTRCHFAPTKAAFPSGRTGFAQLQVCRARLQGEEQAEEDRVASARAEVTKRIKALGTQGKVKDAISALAGLANLGIQPDTRAATALVQACTRDMELAQSIFDEMFGEFLQPDEVTFSVLLRGYGATTPPDWPRIDSTLTTMRVKYGIEPTALSFNALLEVCCRTSDIDRGQDIIDRMAADGVEPDEFTEEVVARRRVLRSYLRKTLL